MASTQALFTAFSGLEANSRFIDVTGNNIANVNTTAFKGSRVAFSDLLYRNTSIGEAPGTFTGGTNPSQVGTGVRVAGHAQGLRSRHDLGDGRAQRHGDRRCRVLHHPAGR